MPKKYLVKLTKSERRECDSVIARLSGSSQKARRARILRQADQKGANWTDQKIAEAYHCRVRTVENIRKRFVEEGFEVALHGVSKASTNRPPLVDGEQEARIIATRLGSPPKGYAGWSLRLLAEQVVLLDIVPAISHETCRQVLKKTV